VGDSALAVQGWPKAPIPASLFKQTGADLTKPTTKVLAGAAVAVLAAAGVAAVVRYRLGRKPDPEERAHLDELETRLSEVEEPDTNTTPTRVGRVVENLQRNHGISSARLRQWITGLRQGTLSPEQATVAESDFGALEREADQGGA
jgi:hypothetical protein